MTLSKNRFTLLLTVAAVVVAVILWYLLRPQPVSGVPEAERPAVMSSSAELIPTDAPIEGPFAAKVTIVEFLDYQCPGCGAYHPVLKSIREEFSGKIRFVVRQFPLSEIHREAKGAAIAAVCAHRQGKFFPYNDTLFEHQGALGRSNLETYASDLGLDMTTFRACLDDDVAEDIVLRDRAHGEALGVRSTPTLFINGKMLSDIPTQEGLRALINKELKN